MVINLIHERTGQLYPDIQCFEDFPQRIELDGFFSFLQVEQHGFANACQLSQLKLA
jgi:hypothetical protein